MFRALNPPLSARDGLILYVLIIARISTDKQDEQSLDDQEQKCRRYVGDCYDGPVEFKVVKSIGSGEHLDRKELVEIHDLVLTRRFDLVVMEDLGRYMRDIEAVRFARLCCDVDTRLIAINDHMDTAEPAWEQKRRVLGGPPPAVEPGHVRPP